MPYDQDSEAYQPRGHSRNRSGKSSTDSKGRGSKPPSQKAMLSRALQKANTAVQLDNAQNFEGARQAYAEACNLLQQVLQRTSGDEDKRKLEAIRRTYTSRIDELDQMAPWQDEDDKALPRRPDSEIHRPDSVLNLDDDEVEEVAIIETATVTKIVRDDSRSPQPPQFDPQFDPYQNQQRQSDLRHRRGASQDKLQPIVTTTLQAPAHGLLHSAFSRSPVRLRAPDNLILQRPDNSPYMPAPLSPRRPLSPTKPEINDYEEPIRTDFSLNREPPVEQRQTPNHIREDSLNSWLDPIDESGGSTSSSVHSRTSSLNIRRKHIRAPSGETEAEFDTALDAAIEAAYDEGYEPMDPDDYDPQDPSEDVIATAMRKVEIARERVRLTELEVQESAMELERQQQTQYPWSPNMPDFYDDNSSDEEDRILEEMDREFGIEQFTMEPPQKAPVPRESDSSGLTSRTWHSSMGSNPPTGATSLSTVTEMPPYSHVSKNSAPSAPPPTQSLPDLPPQRPGSAAQSVRNRRLSGQNPKQLKIETTKLSPALPDHPEDMSLSKSAISNGQEADVTGSAPASRSASGMRRLSSPHLELSPTDPRVQPSPFGHLGSIEGEETPAGRASPSTKKLRKNFSSSSLRSMKSRNMSLSNLEEGSDMSPSTPSSNHFGVARVPTLPPIPTPPTGATAGGGLHLFDDSILSPNVPGSPNPIAVDAPVPLEPCPTDFMLRPFWLMRCLYQTLAHPRGGYLSTKLFVPRDVWRVRGVKLKNVEDKVANCDFLTAALLKIAQVDTCDADAMLVEMQSLEGVLEQVQAALSRKLGNEVGVQSSSILFKEASGAVDENNSGVPRSSSVTGKSSSFSWRRLRSKNSAVGLGGAYNSRFGGQEVGRETPSLPTLPMTPNPTSRPAKRDVTQAQFTGPNAMYMNALARLFDAAQAIDQIARQVEDPGLRHADKTQVGLELCTRHAAEFFGFYICRFVLADLSILLDKFIKRGSEWVLA
ncbi:Fc.00g103040.m01.CDS01 [Cosmosporella sp. VM-42]